MLLLLLVSIYGENILFCVFMSLFCLCVSFSLETPMASKKRSDYNNILVGSVRKQQCVGAGTFCMVMLLLFVVR